MKIQRLVINGFRSLRRINWTPGDLNVVIGPNASGKSNLLRFLELLSMSAQGRLEKYVQDSGGIHSLIWNGGLDDIGCEIMSAIPGEPGSDYDAWAYELVINRLGKSGAHTIRHEQLRSAKDLPSFSSFEKFIQYFVRSPYKSSMLLPNGNAKELSKEVLDSPESLLSNLLSAVFGVFNSQAEIREFGKRMAAWGIYHDLHTNQNAEIRRAAVSRSGKRLDSDGQNLVNVLHSLYTHDKGFQDDIDAAMSAAFGDDYDSLSFPPDATDRHVQLCVRWKSLKHPQPAADLSDGTLRFLLLLTVLAAPDPAPLIAIDEPETGLHPTMLPIIAEFAEGASERSQVIFTTHSPEFLSAFREVQPTVTVMERQDGETVLKVVDGTELKRWLKEYSLGDLYQTGELEGMD